MSEHHPMRDDLMGCEPDTIKGDEIIEAAADELDRLHAIEQAARNYRSECADQNPCPDYMLRSMHAKDLDAALAAQPKPGGEG